MVVENVRFHHAKLLEIFLMNHFKYLPPYSPELNPVERASWYMRKKITLNRSLHSIQKRKKAFWRMFSHYQKTNDELLKVCEINYYIKPRM